MASLRSMSLLFNTSDTVVCFGWGNRLVLTSQDFEAVRLIGVQALGLVDKAMATYLSC